MSSILIKQDKTQGEPLEDRGRDQGGTSPSPGARVTAESHLKPGEGPGTDSPS